MWRGWLDVGAGRRGLGSDMPLFVHWIYLVRTGINISASPASLKDGVRGFMTAPTPPNYHQLYSKRQRVIFIANDVMHANVCDQCQKNHATVISLHRFTFACDISEHEMSSW